MKYFDESNKYDIAWYQFDIAYKQPGLRHKPYATIKILNKA